MEQGLVKTVPKPSFFCLCLSYETFSLCCENYPSKFPVKRFGPFLSTFSLFSLTGLSGKFSTAHRDANEQFPFSFEIFFDRFLVRASEFGNVIKRQQPIKILHYRYQAPVSFSDLLPICSTHQVLNSNSHEKANGNSHRCSRTAQVLPDELILPLLLSWAPFRVWSISCTLAQAWPCVDSHCRGPIVALIVLALF